MTKKELIPEILLKTICCTCETGCNSLKCGSRKYGLTCTSLCSDCHSSDRCSNIEEKTYDELNDSDETVDEVSMQTAINIGEINDDGLEDFDDGLESPWFVESDDKEIPSKRQKISNI